MEYDFLDHDGAQFRRRKGQLGVGVNDVLIRGQWEPYKGDAFAVGMWGDPIPDPLEAAPQLGDGHPQE